MTNSEQTSVVVVGLITGLLSMMPVAFAEDRHERPRGKAADATFIAIDAPDATSTAALDINSAGKIVGRYESAVDGNTHGFVRSEFGQFTSIDFQGAKFTVAAGINSRGDIVGQYTLRSEPANVRHGFLLSNGTFATIDPPGSVFTNALGINRRGGVVGRYCTITANPPCPPDKRHGFLWSGGAFTMFDFPDAAGTNAWGINGRGEIVGSYEDKAGKSHIYRLRESQFKTVDFQSAFDTAPGGAKGGINARGDIVSYYCVAQPCGFNNNSQHGFLLRDGETTTTMDFPHGHVTADFGINGRGEIVGSYNDENGKEHGFLLKLEDRDGDED